MTSKRLLFFLAALGVALSAGGVAAEDVVAIKAGRIITVSGQDIAPGVIVAEDGRITAVGKPDAVRIPWNAEVIDASEGVVMPGMIEAHSTRGTRVTNESMQTVPYLSIRDSLNPVHFYFEDALRDGIIAINVMPGNRTLIGGQGMVVKPHGITVEQMTIKERSGMKVSLSPGRNASRMSHMQKLRRYLTDFREELARRAESRAAEVETATAKGEEVDPETPLDVKKKPLKDLLDGRLRAFVYCPSAADVFKALELKRSYGLDCVLVLGPDGWKAAGVIGKAGIPVVLHPRLLQRERDPETLEEVEHETAALFHAAGVKFALQTEPSALGRRHLWFQAATAMRQGLSREVALKAITLWPAEILGIADRFGSIEVGKDLNCVILTGDPFDLTTWVDRVVFEGRVIYDRRKDKKVARLFAGTPPGQAGKEKARKKNGKKEKPAPEKKKPEKKREKKKD